MRVVEKPLAHEPLHECRILDLGAQPLEGRVEIEQRHRIAAMNCGRQTLEQQLQAVGITVARDFPLVQFQLVQRRVDLVARYALVGDTLQHPQDELLDGLGAPVIAAFESADEAHLVIGVLQPAQRRRRTAELRGLEGVTQRAGTVVEQHAGEQVRPQQLHAVGVAAEQPGEDDVRVSALPRDLVEGVGLFGHPRGVEALLVAHGNARIETLEP